MTKFYKLLTMLFLLLFVATGTVVAQEKFEIYEDFDDAGHFTENEKVPDGWKSEGLYAFSRGSGSDYGISVKSGEYAFSTVQSYEYGRDEVFYTPMMKLAGGKPCTIMFSVYAPGGTPAAVRNNGFTITAGTAQNAEAQTIEVGTVTNASYTSWTDFAFSFTPDADGEYCFGMKLNCSIASSGVVSIDDVTIEGTKPAEVKPEITIAPIYAQIPTAFIGETYTQTVNVKATNLVEDIAIKNISTTEISIEEDSIPMAEAMSAEGYNLVVTVAPTNAANYGGTFELTSKDVAEPVLFQMYWTAIPTENIATLQDVKDADANAGLMYKYTGEAVVTFVDAENRVVYMQDETAGVRVKTDNVSNVKIGDKVSTQYITLQQDEDGLTVIALTESLNVVSSDNAVEVQPVSFEMLAASPRDYVNELVSVAFVKITDFTEPNYSTTPVEVEVAVDLEGTNKGLLAPFAGTDLIGTKKTVNRFDLIGIAVTDTAAVVAPRSLADMQILAAELIASPTYANIPTAFIGETYTTSVTVYGSNLANDVVIKNISTDQITVSADTIPMFVAMSESGYKLDVVLTPTDLDTCQGTFELISEGVDTAMFQLNWTPVEATAVETLQALKDADVSAGLMYKYTGEALVTFVDAENGVVYMQDETAGVRVKTDNVSNVKTGDKVSAQYVTLQQDEDGLTVIALTESLNVVSSDNVLEAQNVTLKELAASPADYVNELVRVREVTITDMNDATFSTAVAISDGNEGLLSLFAGTDVVGADKPEKLFNLTGIAVTDTAAVVAPRSMSDIEIVVLEPNPDNYSAALELPYFNTFDNYDNDYDGTSVVPANWKSVGSYPFFTAAITGLNAVTGTYYIVADESAEDNRDDRLYTPLFRLKAGTEYTISYYLYMPGNSGGGVLRATNLRVTVGSEQDIDFQPITMQRIEGQSISEFTKQEFTFTPEYSGAYCFAFSLDTEVNYSGQVAIEDFNITAPGLVAKPTANFGIGGIFELMYSNMLAYPNQPVMITNLSSNADEFEWTVTCPDGTTITSTDDTPELEFNQNGTYSIGLTAANSAGSRSTTKSVTVQCVNGDYDGSLTTWNPNHDGLMERGLLPSFAAYGNEWYDYDFVSGYNRFYKKVAERFEMPENVVAEISYLNIWLGHYRNRAYTTGYDSEKPFSIVLYGETDGKLDENKVFGRVDSRLIDLFGNSGIGGSAGEPRDVDFTKLTGAPIKTTGTFYLSFEFDKDMTIIPDDPNIGRSYFGMNTVEHATGVATLYAKPDSVPSNSNIVADGNWYRIDEIDPTKKGLGNYFILWAKTSLDAGSVALNSLGEVMFAVRREGENVIVSGTKEGEQVAIYNMNGILVATAIAAENSTSIPVQHLSSGVYVVKAGAGTAKFVR